MVEIETKLKRQNRDHMSHISRVRPDKIKDITRKWKNTKAKFKRNNKIYYGSFKRSGSSPNKLMTGKWIECHPSFQYPDEIFASFPEDLIQNIREDRRAY